jgi:hypothetical protein
MYQLNIWGPTGQRVLQWDPRKLKERDPLTLAIIAEADRILKEAPAQDKAAPHAPSPCIKALGRWVA